MRRPFVATCVLLLAVCGAATARPTIGGGLRDALQTSAGGGLTAPPPGDTSFGGGGSGGIGNSLWDAMPKSGPLQLVCKAEASKGPYQYDMANHQATCADADNQGCATCSLWALYRVAPNDVCAAKQVKQCKKNYYYIASSPEYLILPRFATRGIEDVWQDKNGVRKNGAAIWQDAWADAAIKQGGADSHSGFKDPNTGALVINAPAYRSKHQMHIHVGELDTSGATGRFHRDCLPLLVKNSGTTWASSKAVRCDVTGYKKSGSGYVPFATPADLKAIVTTKLSGVWKDYVTGLQGTTAHPAVKQWAGEAYNHVGVTVVQVPGKKGSWLVILYSGPGDYVGDHSFLRQ